MGHVTSTLYPVPGRRTGNFFLMRARAQPATAFPTRPMDDASPRAIEEIAIEEVAEAAFLCLQKEFSLSHDDLVTQTARLLGYSRTSDRIRHRVQHAINQLLQAGRARIRNDKIELVR